MNLSSRTIQKVFKESALEAGITKPVTIHTLRHSFATHLLIQDTNIYKIQKLLGHKSIKTTSIYFHLAPSYINSNHLSIQQLKAISSISFCKTSKMGSHLLLCNDCGDKKVVYNSCGNRHCPSCGFLSKEMWLRIIITYPLFSSDFYCT